MVLKNNWLIGRCLVADEVESLGDKKFPGVGT